LNSLDTESGVNNSKEIGYARILPQLLKLFIGDDNIDDAERMEILVQ
jgi:hypothetical protein